MENTRGKKLLPPYVSYRTFRNFIDGLQLGIPARIDRSYWGERLSGSTGTQLMSALRFLGLIDKYGEPTVRLRQLVSAKGAQRVDTLRQTAHTSFAFLTENSLNSGVATYAQLEEAFYNSYGVTGDVARKCIKFFIDLESDAGIPVSSFILKRSNKVRTSKRGSSSTTDSRTNRNSSMPTKSPEVPGRNNWPGMVLAKFPTFDPMWPDDVKLKWFEAFDTLLKKGLLSYDRE